MSVSVCTQVSERVCLYALCMCVCISKSNLNKGKTFTEQIYYDIIEYDTALTQEPNNPRTIS